MKPTRKELNQIEAQISKIAHQILTRLGKQCSGDTHLAIAALAVAMCSIARADGTSLADLDMAVSIAHGQINEVEA